MAIRRARNARGPAAAAARLQRRPANTLFAGVILAAFLVLVLFAVPPVMPAIFHRLAGLAAALLAAVAAYSATREFAGRYNRIALPWGGSLNTAKLAAGLAAASALAWWFGPWSPLRLQ